MGYVCDSYDKFRLTMTVNGEKLFDGIERAISTRHNDTRLAVDSRASIKVLRVKI